MSNEDKKRASSDALVHVFGGDEEDRTPDLGIANAALSQLSYTPNLCEKQSIIAFEDANFAQNKGKMQERSRNEIPPTVSRCAKILCLSPMILLAFYPADITAFR